jgi:GcrA cell cycle regulator
MSPWTKEREAELAVLYERDGLSAAQIAARMYGITRNAVIGKVHRMGLERGVGMPIAAVVAQPPIVCDAPATPAGLRLIDLEPNQCRFPSGDHDYTFCGKTCVPKRPYCPKHNLLVRGWRSGGTMEVAG